MPVVPEDLPAVVGQPVLPSEVVAVGLRIFMPAPPVDLDSDLGGAESGVQPVVADCELRLPTGYRGDYQVQQPFRAAATAVRCGLQQLRCLSGTGAARVAFMRRTQFFDGDAGLKSLIHDDR